ncbi:hypothetical protein BBP40_008771 [Aspergillus hancockii]|nr:hypothetical protein BBP40_008771 [Aspergillus hancockii]
MLKDRSSLAEWEVASCILNKLNKSYLYYEDAITPLSGPGFGDESLSEGIDRQSETFNPLTFWLVLLLRKPQAFDLFGMAYVLSLLPRMNALFNPIYARVPLLLHEQDVKHDHWFCKGGKGTMADVKDKLSAVTLSKTCLLSGVIYANKHACDSASKVLRLVERGEDLDSIKTKYYNPICELIVLLSQYLGGVPGIAFDKLTRMEARSKRCRIIVEAWAKERKMLEKLHNSEIKVQFDHLVNCLKSLRMGLETVSA